MSCRPRVLYRLRFAVDTDDDELFFECVDDVRAWLNANADALADSIADSRTAPRRG